MKTLIFSLIVLLVEPIFAHPIRCEINDALGNPIFTFQIETANYKGSLFLTYIHSDGKLSTAWVTNSSGWCDAHWMIGSERQTISAAYCTHLVWDLTENTVVDGNRFFNFNLVRIPNSNKARVSVFQMDYPNNPEEVSRVMPRSPNYLLKDAVCVLR